MELSAQDSPNLAALAAALAAAAGDTAPVETKGNTNAQERMEQRCAIYIPLSTHLSFSPSSFYLLSQHRVVHPFTHTYISISPSVHLPIQPPIHPSADLPVWLSICLSLDLNLPTQPLISLSTHTRIYPSIYLSIHSSKCLTNQPF